MKHSIILAAVMLATSFSANAISPADITPNDSVVNSIKLKTLHTRKAQLEEEITVQDAKRNAQVYGVAPETMEAMNNRQDSLCLALRSELVDVILEIKEITPSSNTAPLLQQYNRLIEKVEKMGAASGKEEDTVGTLVPLATPEKREE